MGEIQLDNVTKRFADGTVAVDKANFTIEDGEFFILVGPSGCGKSTLLNMIVGLEDISEGTLRVDGKEVNDVDPKDRDMAMVFQSYAIYPHMTVRRNMGFPLELAKVDSDEITRRVEEAAESLELTELLDRKPAALSGGQRQRVAMGRAIVREPQAFLMDEPLSNLDAKLRVQMRTEISRIQQRLGTTTVYVTHDQVEAMTLGDRVAVLRRGIVQQVDSPRTLYNRPDNLFVAGFIGSPSMNFLAGERGDDGTIELPIGTITVPESLRETLDGASDRIIVGIRPEHIEDASLVEDRDDHLRFSATIDVVEWMGSELYAHFQTEGSQSDELEELAEELDQPALGAGDRAEMVARLDANSKAAEGEELEMVVDSDRVVLFDAETGANLFVDDQRD
ncbi:MAG: sn-glycerol-3-phosphate ABC transporter ATP-binding protein UgpC [Candidatus Microthrix subdominans]|uniref:Sn-glycerol-3-phosphate ABC transporter ATP-binding protein UgpC n=1 Tax=Candidatus Neomicrothrix subdominans TaxID=2954438 RepID=A0A936NBP5_9ACTN|nr:sn-glycerol-3-phosphate ABC transporter ATP-binding protein UgpC [Candidatus Microthrix sp.]MBK9297025.1 sn-glycerol-3-phosphate ABC transporter ATP-binding protein UgpC [Candidatus Microthrix subdominans]MBK6439774.1 sn-glycerol-3-phosphate ABC transporter ATP-binding protein UgpC [Candidatus Microthrix sp.]MBK7164003.1 sn-glycerol-3-phosphate ABC transporter ATP-binding protein UgpC [Candidatus Microthrix sp.]MBK9558046.1 sn-glycerol-3-phosphate ABC transporter ATP-binding protein UgpC [Ca